MSFCIEPSDSQPCILAILIKFKIKAENKNCFSYFLSTHYHLNMNFRSPSANVQIIKISGREGARGAGLERQHRSVTKVTLRGELEARETVTTVTRSSGAKRRANSFAAVTTSGSLSLNRAPSIEKRLEDTERSVSSRLSCLKKIKGL